MLNNNTKKSETPGQSIIVISGIIGIKAQMSLLVARLIGKYMRNYECIASILTFTEVLQVYLLFKQPASELYKNAPFQPN